MMYLFLSADLILVFLLSMYTNKYLRLPIWKIVVFSLAVVPCGLFCSKLMRLIEAGTWEGSSFYGALLFEPVIMMLFGLLIKIKPVEMFILGAPSGCVSLCFLKIQCLIAGCCYGRIIYYQENGRPVRFPSQIVEMICGIILLLVILWIIRHNKERGYVYAWFLFLYGVSRFFLNLLRDTEPFVLGLSAGCFWSIISALIGASWLLIGHRKKFLKPGK